MQNPNPQCGDQLAAEIELSGVPKELRPDYPLCSFDAEDWAKAFVAKHPIIDHEEARAWFACALMRGFDEGVGRAAASEQG